MSSIQIDPQKLKEKIGFVPTKNQQFILENLNRFSSICGGRRTGKSFLIAWIALRELLASNRRIWIVAPSYALAKVIWSYVLDWAIRHFSGLFEINKSDMSIRNKVTNSLLELESADSPVSLKGVGLSLLIVDEAGDIADDVFEKYLLPNIAEKRPELNGELGRAILIGNSSHRGTYFFRMFKSKEPDTFTYHLPTAIEDNMGNVVASNNPEIITVEELKRIKANTSDLSYRQNFLAEFISGTGTVFRNINDCVDESLSIRSAPDHYRRYVCGIDLGRRVDHSVITVIDRDSHEVVYWDRFNQIDWDYQQLKIVEVAKDYKCRVILDATGLGDVLFSSLSRKGVSVEPVVFNNENKKDIIEKLSLFVEKARIKFPKIPQLIEELESYEYKMSSVGKVIYNAPAGSNSHDDCVISLALAVKDLAPQPRTTQGDYFRLKGQHLGIKMNQMLNEPTIERSGGADSVGEYL